MPKTRTVSSNWHREMVDGSHEDLCIHFSDMRPHLLLKAHFYTLITLSLPPRPTVPRIHHVAAQTTSRRHLPRQTRL